MEFSTVTHHDLALIIDLYDTAEEFDRFLKFFQNSDVEFDFESPIGRILSLYDVLLSVCPLYRTSDSKGRSNEEQKAFDKILDNTGRSCEERADRLLAGARPEKTEFTLSDEARLLRFLYGVRDLEDACHRILNHGPAEPGSYIDRLYRIRELLPGR